MCVVVVVCGCACVEGELVGATTKGKHKVKHAATGDLVLVQGLVVAQRLAGKDETLLLGRDALFLLNLLLHMQQHVRALHIELNFLSCQRSHFDQHGRNYKLSETARPSRVCSSKRKKRKRKKRGGREGKGEKMAVLLLCLGWLSCVFFFCSLPNQESGLHFVHSNQQQQNKSFNCLLLCPRPHQRTGCQ